MEQRSSNWASYVDICWNIFRRRSVALYWQIPAYRSPYTSCLATIACRCQPTLNEPSDHCRQYQTCTVLKRPSSAVTADKAGSTPQQRTYEGNWSGFLQAGCPSCRPANSFNHWRILEALTTTIRQTDTWGNEWRPSIAHSRLKSYLFHKSYPVVSLLLPRTASTDYCPDRFFWATRLLFLVFPYFLHYSIWDSGHRKLRLCWSG